MNKIFLSWIICSILILISVILIQKSKRIKDREEKRLLQYATICFCIIFHIDYLYTVSSSSVLFSTIKPLCILAIYFFIRFAISLFFIAKKR